MVLMGPGLSRIQGKCLRQPELFLCSLQVFETYWPVEFCRRSSPDHINPLRVNVKLPRYIFLSPPRFRTDRLSVLTACLKQGFTQRGFLSCEKLGVVAVLQIMRVIDRR